MLHIVHDVLSKSANEVLHGEHNFNAQPCASPIYKAIIQNHLQSCTSWIPRGIDTMYTGQAKDHYWYNHIYILDTKKYWIYKGITFLLKFCTIPKVQPWDCFRQKAEYYLLKLSNWTKGAIQTSPSIGTNRQNHKGNNCCNNFKEKHTYGIRYTHCITHKDSLKTTSQIHNKKSNNTPIMPLSP